MSLPHPKPLQSFWTSKPYRLRTHRTTTDLPTTADVVIIGSGYSGAATAFHLLKPSENRPSVVILEARETCSGASGRNGGHLKPDPYLAAARWSQAYGAAMAAEMVEFEMRQLWHVKKLVDEEKIDCDFELTRAMDVFVDPVTAKPAIEAWKKMAALGFPFSQDLHVVSDGARAERISGVKGAQAVWTFSAASVWVLKLVSHLLERCLEWGANLQTNTSVLSITDNPRGEGYLVTTPRGIIKAGKVVTATNAYTGALVPELADKIIPCRGVAARIAVPGNGTHAPHLNNTYSIKFGPQEYDYLIPKSDGSIIVGGAKQQVLKDEAFWRNTCDDSQLVPGATEYFDGYMQRTFRGWESSGAKVTHLWSGIMGYSEDMAPWVGELPTRPGIYVLAGFSVCRLSPVFSKEHCLSNTVTGPRHATDIWLR